MADLVLTPHFKLSELAGCHHAALAARQDELARNPGILSALQCLAILLEVVRAQWGKPLVVSPGFRYAEQIDGKWYGYDVRAQGKVQGSRSYRPKSQHTKGEAADFDIPGVKHDEIFEWLADECGHPFGQVINETRGRSRWIHLSIPGARASGAPIEGECLSYVYGRDPAYRHERDRLIACRRWSTP